LVSGAVAYRLPRQGVEEPFESARTEVPTVAEDLAVPAGDGVRRLLLEVQVRDDRKHIPIVRPPLEFRTSARHDGEPLRSQTLIELLCQSRSEPLPIRISQKRG